MIDELARHIGNIGDTDWQTLALILLFCGATALSLKEYVAPILSILALPLLFVASALIHYSFVLGELYVPSRLDQWLMWTILAAICGNMIGIAFVAAIGRLRDRAASLHGRARAARTHQRMR